MKQVIHTPEAPAAVGPYSQAIAAGQWLFTAGQIPLVPGSGDLVEGGIAEQTTQVLENLTAVLRANGMQLSDIVKTTVFLTDLADFQEMNAVYASFFGEAKPARSTVQVAALPKDARVEIEAIATR
jgi:2-iminobutanoate/2-iminopropanoate deaminase